MGYRIEILRARVTSADHPLNLQPRALELALALATRGGRLSMGALNALLYPDLDADTSNDRVRVNVFRLREQAPALIERSRSGGYALSKDCTIDLDEIETFARSASASLTQHCRLLHRYVRALADDDARHVTQKWAWFDPVEARLASLRADLFERYIGCGVPLEFANEALSTARSVLSADPCDESAYGLALRALLAMDRRIEAMRMFRDYEQVVRNEYNTEPSAHLRNLLEAAG